MWWGLFPVAVIAAASTAGAQSPPQERVVVKAAPSCSVEDRDGGRQLAMDCLNALWVDGGATAQPRLIADRAGPRTPEQLGTFSFTAQAIRMGNNFGKSAQPQRPAQTIYANPLMPGGR